MKTYHGKRQVLMDPGPVTVTKNGTTEPLAVRNDLVRHSTALNWGYYGSGPAQLAFALMMDALGDAFTAGQFYQAFKEEVVSGFDDEWSLSEQAIYEWMRQYRLRGYPPARVFIDDDKLASR
jgi:hypothetical protein